MKEYPILFNTDMVKAILEGRKTQTRRVVKVQPTRPDFNKLCQMLDSTASSDTKNKGKFHWGKYENNTLETDKVYFSCPYGKVGDRLWVRETFCMMPNDSDPTTTLYKADMPMHWDAKDTGTGINDIDLKAGDYKWKPSIHMPRLASRITIEITDIRVERLQDISDDDADKEGFGGNYPSDNYSHIFYGGKEKWSHLSIAECYGILWNSIYQKRDLGWDKNPWVWVVEFKVVEN